MKIFIKNMVCGRCIAAVSNIFDEVNIEVKNISLGEVETTSDVSEKELQKLENLLEGTGFERIKDSSLQFIEKIKNLIIVKISELDIAENFLLSDFLRTEHHKDYSAISKTFSQNENLTV
ncbi:MAG: AraC family transcriptional regulator, partial [Chryseobacterium sp.]